MITSLRLALLTVCAMLLTSLRGEPLKIAIVSLDTSHAGAFTKLLHDPKNPDHVPGGRVIAAYPGGSPDIEKSISRVPGFVKQMEGLGVKIASSIAEACTGADAIMVVAVDGRAHLPHLREVVKVAAGKPLFVDKPLAANLAEAAEIYRLAKQHNMPMFSASSLRYAANVKPPKADKIRVATAYSPCELEPHHQDLFWYGVHGVETMYALLGTGCVTVQRTQTENSEVTTGVWSDGRVGVVLGLRNSKTGYGFQILGEKAVVTESVKAGYAPLIREVMKFFQTKQPPVSAAECLEVIAFMEASDLSKKQGGKAVSMADLLKPYGDLLTK